MTDLDDIAEVTEVVRSRIAVNRERGLEEAYRVVGARLGITPRRAKSFWLRQVTTIAIAEWRRIMEGAAEWVEKDTRRLEAQNRVLRARLAAGAAPVPRTLGFVLSSSWDGVERRGDGPADRGAALAAVTARSVS